MCPVSRFTFILLLTTTCWGVSHAQAADPPSAGDIEFFEKKIRPLLAEHCFSCHSSGAKTIHGSLLLDSAAALSKGGDSGPAVVPHKPQESLLISALHYDGDYQMPPKGRLPDAEIALLTEWVERGAPFPAGDKPAERPDGSINFEAGRRFWSFQPVSVQPLPPVQHASWPLQRLDHFVLAAMEGQGLSPSTEADRATLLRRLSFDLTGLPPTPQEVQDFLNDDSPDAWQTQVDRLLKSPHFGERWARFWLDLARYTDKTASWLDSTGEAWLYRDWVVDAMNQDMPYDDFIRRQLATDMMQETGPEDIPALGFIGLSPNYWKELKLPAEIIKVIVADEWEERVDAVSRTFLGLTVACARCHDHKFDPISTEDYYALAGVFASCRIGERPTIAEELYQPVRKAKSEVETLQKELAKLKKQKPLPQQKIDELTARISDIQSATPWYDARVATAVLEESLYVKRAGERADQGTKLDYQPGPQDLHLFIRGNPNRLGDVVPRRFLTVLSENTPKPFRNGSGRLELADAITREAASLTARVIVNRIWAIYFGRGIVTTPSNFGQQGARPTHPELLDDLAARLIEQNWSLKQLHREIVMSATYRQTSRIESANSNTDPENQWLSRMNRRRLEFEQWRDAMLAASGQLDLTIGGASVALDAAGNHRRTLYATVHRREMSNVLLTHDFPAPTAHSEQRVHTTTALQGLYALNGPLLQAEADALVNRLQQAATDDTARIQLAYTLLYARAPTEQETALGLNFLGDSEGEQRVQSWQQYAHALLASNEMMFVD
ncbi:MAG: PSD1 and planctomycete cytochrome C domain-containing protein [Fuerstiella sp.]